MNFRVRIPDGVIKAWQKASPASSFPDLVRDAITMFNWAVEERAQGRIILSAADESCEAARRLSMQSLEKITKTRKEKVA